MEINAPAAVERRANRAFMAWLTLVVLLLFSIAAPLNQFKVPPIIPVLMTSLGLSVSGAGMLMSVYAVTGLILAIPSGFILQRVGFRITGLIAGGSIVIGSVLGALSATIGTLLVSRVIEGAGTGFMAVLAPALIAQWFVASRRGTAMGIWSAWVPIGSAVTLIVAPPLAQAYGWRAVWWFGAIYALAVTVLYLVVVRPAPPGGAGAPTDGHSAGAAVSSKQVLRNRNIWLLAAAFAGFIAVVIGSSTYLPTFLATKRGIPLSQAALLAAIPTLITIFSAPGGGILSDRIGSRKKPYLVGIALSIVLVPLAWVATGPGLIVVLVVTGLALGIVPMAIFSAAVESAAVEASGHERQSGMAMAVIMVGQNAGLLLGPIVFGTLAQSVGWTAAFASIAMMAVLGLLAGWLAKVR
jgi:MFS family permease